MRYELVGEAVGGLGISIAEPGEIEGALDQLLQAPGLAVLNAWTDPMAGRLRKDDPRLQMVAHEDILAGLRPGYVPPVA